MIVGVPDQLPGSTVTGSPSRGVVEENVGAEPLDGGVFARSIDVVKASTRPLPRVAFLTASPIVGAHSNSGETLGFSFLNLLVDVIGGAD